MNHSKENDYHHNALDQIKMSNSTFAAVKVVFPQDWAFVPLYNSVGIAIVSENVLLLNLAIREDLVTAGGKLRSCALKRIKSTPNFFKRLKLLVSNL